MRQAELFEAWSRADAPPAHVPGLSLREGYITADEEKGLLAHVDSGPWATDWRRRIQQFGAGYAGEHGGAPTWVRDFPRWLLRLAARVQADAPLERFPENCVINEYIPPLGIGAHKDYAAFGPTIACVSLGDDAVLEFTHPERRVRVPVHVPARSLWVITGEARSEWLHGIAARLTDVVHGERRRRERRVSITFRTVLDRRIVPSSHGSEIR